ncbi:MAG: porin family protein [Paludibacteraceae bacterium]|nr:porin family protein [Paludibacteraceae bacterium]
MKKLLVVLTCLLPLVGLMAESVEKRSERPHECRFMVGDCLSESLFWYDDTPADYRNVGTASSRFTERQKTFWTPHLAVEYLYRLNSWCSLGGQVDFQYTGWQNVVYNNQNAILDRSPQGFYNLSLMPTARFTYYHSPSVDIYSSISLGMDINGGSEVDMKGHHTAVGVALEMAVLGFTFGKERWYGCVEGGGLSAMKNKGTLFMAMSRILTIGVGYRF